MPKKKQIQGITQFRCSSCNAPYPLGADDVIATCPYCGFTFKIDGGELKNHLIVPNKTNADQVKTAVRDWLSFAASRSVGKGIMNGITIEEPILQWIPIFRVKGSTEAYHLGYKKEKQGNSSVLRKMEGTNREFSTVWVLARRHAGTFGVNEFITDLDTADAESFNITEIKAPILNAEISEDDATSRARYNKSELDREILQEEMDKLLDYRLTIDIEDCAYVHVPYWLSRYEYNNGTFRVAFSGSSGNVVLGELPVTKRYRLFRWISSILLLVSSALVFQALPYISYAILSGSSDSEAALIPFIIAAAGIFLFAASYYEMGKVLRYELRIDAEGDERDTKSITGRVKSFWEVFK